MLWRPVLSAWNVRKGTPWTKLQKFNAEVLVFYKKCTCTTVVLEKAESQTMAKSVVSPTAVE